MNAPAPTSMTKDEYQFLADMVRKRSGLVLTEDKGYLLESRLLPVARNHGAQSISELCVILRARATEALLTEITEAMTTNESSFFRDIKPYDHLRKMLLPELIERPNTMKTVRIWSAACSTGQEPYTIGMCLLEDAAKMPGWRFEIVATDLAQKVIDKAKQGIYSQFEAQRGLPIQLLVKYFTSLPDTSWQLKDTVRSMVQFKLQNLLEEYAALGKFDIIFCRNVLIYFDDAMRAQVTAKMARSLQPHGTLILGGTESLVDPQKQFMPVESFRGAYKLK